MNHDFFEAPLFIESGASHPLLDFNEYPYLLNEGGRGRQVNRPPREPIPIEPVDRDVDLGTKYTDIGHSSKDTPGDPSFRITLFDFHVDEVHYEALPATKETVRGFGMTLLRDGECVRFPYEGLLMAQYTYGKWAGHQSPYLGPQRRRELLTINPTDLEFHDFAHVFFSQDDVPLVITVARWRPYVNEIALADLWVKPGDAIVLPPKLMPPPPSPFEDPRCVVVDLHTNRNSALAAWDDPLRPSVRTTTILGNEAVRKAEATRPRYHEEPRPTVHESTRPPRDRLA